MIVISLYMVKFTICTLLKLNIIKISPHIISINKFEDIDEEYISKTCLKLLEYLNNPGYQNNPKYYVSMLFGRNNIEYNMRLNLNDIVIQILCEYKHVLEKYMS